MEMILIRKTCLICGKTFNSKSNAQKYCSDKCRKQREINRRNENKTNIKNEISKINKEFEMSLYPNSTSKNPMDSNNINIYCDLTINTPYYEIIDLGHGYFKRELKKGTNPIKPFINKNLSKNEKQYADDLTHRIKRLKKYFPNFQYE